MTMMVASGSFEVSSSVSVQDNGSRNKRKFHADPPLSDVHKALPLPQIDCSKFEFVKSHDGLGIEQNRASDSYSLNECRHEFSLSEASLLSSQRPLNFAHGELRNEVDDSPAVYWSTNIVTDLEELVLSNLDVFFKGVIKKITSYGYNEEITAQAILKSDLCYGCKDAESNIIENILSLLKNGQNMFSSRDKSFSSLQQLEKSVLDEMVCVLTEYRPSLSRGDALWCLLKCDMNMAEACAIDESLNRAVNIENQGNRSKSSCLQLKSEENASNLSTSKLYSPKAIKPNHTEESLFSSPQALKESSIVCSCISRSSSSTSSVDGKTGAIRKGRGNGFRRENNYRKHIPVEKVLRTHGTKGTSKLVNLSSWGGSFSDKKCNSVPDSATSSLNTSSNIGKVIELDASQKDGSTDFSIESKPKVDLKVSGSVSGLPFASTELSLSLSSEVSNSSKSTCNIETDNTKYGRNSSGKELVKPILRDKIILKLAEIRKFEEWGTQKVKEAIGKLNQHRTELNTLRQEKEEVLRLVKEKQALEENTMKKLVEMENALCKAGGQVERASATIRKLELENCQLRHEMENAQSQAAQSAFSCRDVTRREEEMMKKIQSLEKQKALFQEELESKKHELLLLQRQIEQAIELQDQLEARCRQEEKTKEKAREQLEALAKSKEGLNISKAESDFQTYRDVIRKLEKEIAHLRLKVDSPKLAALHWGNDVTFASHMTNSKNILSLKETNPHSVSENIDFPGDISRNRECVMCLSDEMSVVFLPCAHQVVCVKCNELHQKHGMKECPSCRVPIQRRICVRSANS